MIDLSFLTDEEQEAILEVLQRDADLKRAEEERVRHLPEKVNDDTQIKNMSGQWFYEAKSKRHREKIHGADIIRASMRRKPLTAELNQRKAGKTKNSWVNNVNQEVLTQPTEETGGELKPSQSNISNTLGRPQEDASKLDISPSKQRKNPFNVSVISEENAKSGQPENGMASLSESRGKDSLSPSIENQPRVTLTNHNRVEESEQALVGTNELQTQAGKPVPKARKNVHKTSDVSLKSDDSFSKAPGKIKQVDSHGTPPRGILKRSPSSSSTDSEVLRLNQNSDQLTKSGVPTSTILEDAAEKSSPSGEAEGFSQNSLERLKQVRFSSNVSRKGHRLNLELQESKESGEFKLLDSDYVKSSDNHMDGSDALQNSQSWPRKPPWAHSPALDGTTEDRGVSQEGEVAPGSCEANSTTDLPSDTLQPMKSTFVDPLPPNESPGKISHLVGEEQIAETQPRRKAKELGPEPEAASKSTTGQELTLAKIEDPQASKVGSADLEQGKPALVEGQRAKTASTPDKHAAEVLKAADESISKVLDWFKRTSNTAGKEETDMTKARELAVTREDNELSTYGLNLDSPAHEREEPTNKEYLFREQQEQPSFTKAVDQNLNKTGETAVEANNERDGENSSVGEQKAFEDKNIHPGLKTMDSSLGKVMKRAHSIQAYTDGEQDVKLFLEEGSFESQPGEPVEEPKGKQSESEENMQLANQGHCNLQQNEIKQSSPENKKSVKDIRAFWEREETPKLGSKGDLLNKSTSASNTILNSKKEPHRVKPEGGSSGYVTAESDNEQGKYNLVTFRRVILSENESEPDKDDIKLSSGMTAPRLIDESKPSHPMDRSGKIFSSNQESTEFSELPGGENFHSRPSTVSFSKEGGSSQPVVLEKEKTPPTLQQKSQFKIHSLKEKLDEDSKAQMLNPSQFQSLRSFWDVGAKPQSSTDEGKAAVTVPRNRNSGAEDYQEKSEELKEASKGMRQVVLGDEHKKQILQEEKVEGPNANISSLNLLETSRVISKEAGQPMPSLSVDTFPKGSLQFVLLKDSYLEGKTLLPVAEHIEKTEVLSHLSSFDSGLQKLLLEVSQESLPVYPAADEKGVPSLGLSAEVQMPSDDQLQQCKMARKGEITPSEVVEAVNRTLVPSKVDTRARDQRLEKLLKETSDVKTSPKQPIVVAVIEQKFSPSEQKRFFHKVMERSHDLDPSSQQKDSVSPEETEIAMTKHTSSRDHDDDLKASKENVSKSTEDSNSVPQRAPNVEESHGYLNDPTSPVGVFQIPSVELVLPNAHLATQNKANSPIKEVSETVAEVNVPSKNKYSDMNARLACLLNEPATTPCILTTTENDPETQFEGTPGETQERSFFSSQTVPASPQVTNSSRETVSKITKRSADEDGGSILATIEDETGEEAAVVSPFKYHEHLRAEEHTVSGGEQPKDVAETVVKAIKPNSYEPAAFKASLHKLLDEDSEITEVTKPTLVLLQTDQNVNSFLYKVAPHGQEIIETIEKTNVSSRQAELKASFQKLLKEETEVPPSKEESRPNSNGIPLESRSNQDVNLSDQPKISQEISEIVSRTVVPSKEKQREFNSGLQKLLEESALTQSSQLTSLNGPESMKDFPQEANETIIKSTVPAKDDVVFKSNLGKLIRESSGASLQISMEDNPEAADDSTAQLKKQSSSVKMLPSAPSPLSDFRTEIKIPLKGKAFKQDIQTIEGVPKTITVFQKTVQVNISSAKVAHQEEGEDKREKHYAREGEAEVTVALLDNANEVVDVLPGFQRTSTPNKEKESPLRVSKVELNFGTKKADEKNNEEEDDEEEDGKSFGSDLSDELNSSFVEIQRSRTRSEDESNPVMEALKRSSNRQIPSKSLEDIPSATSNKGKINLPKEDYMLSAEDDQKTEHPDEINENVQGISTAPTFPVNQFSRPEKVKQMSKSVPTFVQEESDDRETDTASDSSYPLGRIKKSPSSLTNLSGSSGLASLSSVSTSAMSIYSGDFGNVDVKGNIQFAIDYVEQLKELHIFIAQGKDLAIGDVKKQRSDPYVKSYLLPEKYKLGKRKTSVKKKTLNPVFNEILRYKVDKELLATQRLNISVWHNDIFGRNSFLGEVELDLHNWDWNDKQNKQMIWYPLKPRTPLASLEAENRGDIKIALQYVPQPAGGKKTPASGEVHIWVKECNDLPILRGNRINSFVKCTVLPDTSRKSRQKTRAIAKTTNPAFNHTMVYDGFKPEDLKEACVELTVWDHNKLANHFLGGLRIGFGTGKSYGTPVDWMDSTLDEICLWERMINSPNEWVEDTLPLRMLTVIKMAK